jgi:AbiV family abortive infection protein
VASSQAPQMTTELLRSYSEAALQNADQLLVGASLLRDHGHDARAYFLAIACIEETGKALLVYGAQNRNLSDPAVCTKLKVTTESHAHKIGYALATWAMDSPNQREALTAAIDLVSEARARTLDVHRPARRSRSSPDARKRRPHYRRSRLH